MQSGSQCTAQRFFSAAEATPWRARCHGAWTSCRTRTRTRLLSPSLVMALWFFVRAAERRLCRCCAITTLCLGRLFRR
jgi:hypothetical protein